MDRVTEDSTPPHWAVDAHVHIRPESNLDAYLELATKRLEAQAPHIALMLTDMRGEQGLKALNEDSGWSLERHCDVAVARRDRPAGALWVVQGYQVNTAERLEVLALAAPRAPQEGLSLTDTITQVIESGAVPVLPWGFGKWLGGRARHLAGLIERREFLGQVAFADSGNRPLGWRYPKLLVQAAEQGYAVIHGSDSLPLKGDSTRIGSVGALLQADLDADPVTRLRRALLRPRSNFGQPMSPLQFLRLQLQLRLGIAKLT